MRPIAWEEQKAVFWCPRCGTLYEDEFGRQTRSITPPSRPEIHGIVRWREHAEECPGMLAYIVGPYRAGTREAIRRNVRRAAEAAALVFRRGYTPICPHTMTERIADMEGAPGHADPVWLVHMLALLQRCDMAVRLPGWEASEGAREEIDFAEKAGIPVYDIEQLQPARAGDTAD
jgi:hypothetical protein